MSLLHLRRGFFLLSLGFSQTKFFIELLWPFIYCFIELILLNLPLDHGNCLHMEFIFEMMPCYSSKPMLKLFVTTSRPNYQWQLPQLSIHRSLYVLEGILCISSVSNQTMLSVVHILFDSNLLLRQFSLNSFVLLHIFSPFFFSFLHLHWHLQAIKSVYFCSLYNNFFLS